MPVEWYIIIIYQPNLKYIKISIFYLPGSNRRLYMTDQCQKTGTKGKYQLGVVDRIFVWWEKKRQENIERRTNVQSKSTEYTPLNIENMETSFGSVDGEVIYQQPK